ncbi:MAG: type IX secretion system sortase PorU, partial [Bacteroidaceae bacterium]|nr:type IX secretion system sortase PorU [Bacteroidaceae bacterium]
MFFPNVLTAQNDFETVEWNIHNVDSVLPLCVKSMPLGKDYARLTYSVAVEYPAYVPLTKDEVRLVLPHASEISSELVIHTHVGVSRREGVLDAWFVPIVKRDGTYYRISSFRWNISVSPLLARHSLGVKSAAPAINDGRYARQSVLSSGKWVKIRVSENGVYKLTSSVMRKMGFSNPAKVRLYGYGGNVLRETSIAGLPDDLSELPMFRITDGALFYAYGPTKWTYNRSRGIFEHKNNPYSSYSYYFLTESDSIEPMTIPVDNSPSSVKETVSVGMDYALYEKDEFCWLQTGSQMFDSYEFSGASKQSYKFALANVTSSVASATVSFSASSATKLLIGCDDKNVGSLDLSNPPSYSAATVSKGFYTIASLSDNPVVTLSMNSASARGHLDYIALNYTRDLVMNGSQMLFRNPKKTGDVCFRVKPNAGADLQAWRVSSPTSYSKLDIARTADGYGEISVSNSLTDEYLVFDANGSFPSPTVVGKVANQNLHSIESADMVIIVPESGLTTAAAKRLAQIHSDYNGLNAVVVRADEIYNEFSSGTPDATAYRRFMKMLYDRASDVDRAPRYLLLFGDGAWDNRMLASEWSGASPSDYLLCYESDNSVSETDSYVCEDYYGFLDDTEGGNNIFDKVDIGVGRIPVRSSSEADAVVDKIEAYLKNTKAGSWKNTILVVADDGNENDHMISAEKVAAQTEYSYPGFRVERLYFDNYERETTSTGNTYPMARARMTDILDAGTLFVNYSGHGNPTQLSHEMVILLKDFERSNNGRMPLWLTAACDVAPFDK